MKTAVLSRNWPEGDSRHPRVNTARSPAPPPWDGDMQELPPHYYPLPPLQLVDGDWKASIRDRVSVEELRFAVFSGIHQTSNSKCVVFPRSSCGCAPTDTRSEDYDYSVASAAKSPLAGSEWRLGEHRRRAGAASADLAPSPSYWETDSTPTIRVKRPLKLAGVMSWHRWPMGGRGGLWQWPKVYGRRWYRGKQHVHFVPVPRRIPRRRARAHVTPSSPSSYICLEMRQTSA